MNHEYDEIRDNMLGWDITDYGLGRFDEVGFSLITLRNGNPKKKDQYPKPYAEKLLYIKEGQMAPMHFHWYKMEDIINRGGGNVLIRVYNSTPEGEFADTPVTVHCDGRAHTVPAGTQVRLTPGQSITVFQNMYHDFELEPGTGPVLLGEVSMCNDDEHDNRFYEPIGRFPEIEDLAVELKKNYTIVMVTHNMQQAARISDKTAFFLLGEVVEYGETEQIFSMPKNKKTEDYITGRFG